MRLLAAFFAMVATFFVAIGYVFTQPSFMRQAAGTPLPALDVAGLGLLALAQGCSLLFFHLLLIHPTLSPLRIVRLVLPRLDVERAAKGVTLLLVAGSCINLFVMTLWVIFVTPTLR